VHFQRFDPRAGRGHALDGEEPVVRPDLAQIDLAVGQHQDHAVADEHHDLAAILHRLARPLLQRGVEGRPPPRIGPLWIDIGREALAA
jgi:hypothetical protein